MCVCACVSDGINGFARDERKSPRDVWNKTHDGGISFDVNPLFVSTLTAWSVGLDLPDALPPAVYPPDGCMCHRLIQH